MLEPKRFADRRHGIIKVALPPQSVAQVNMEGGVIRLVANRLAELADRLVELPGVERDFAEVVVGRREVGLVSERLPELGHCPLLIADFSEDLSQDVMGDGERWLEPDCLTKLFDGRFVVPLVAQRAAEIRVHFRDTGLELQGLSMSRNGFIELPFFAQDLAQVRVGAGVIGLKPHRLALFGNCTVEVALIMQGCSQVRMTASTLRTDHHNGHEVARRFLWPPISASARFRPRQRTKRMVDPEVPREPPPGHLKHIGRLLLRPRALEQSGEEQEARRWLLFKRSGVGRPFFQEPKSFRKRAVVQVAEGVPPVVGIRRPCRLRQPFPRRGIRPVRQIVPANSHTNRPGRPQFPPTLSDQPA